MRPDAATRSNVLYLFGERKLFLLGESWGMMRVVIMGSEVKSVAGDLKAH